MSATQPERPRHLAGARPYLLTRNVCLGAGHHAKVVEAGTVVYARKTWPEIVTEGYAYVYAPGRSGSFRISGTIYPTAIRPL